MKNILTALLLFLTLSLSVRGASITTFGGDVVAPGLKVSKIPNLITNCPVVVTPSGVLTNAAGSPDGTKFLRDDGVLAVPVATDTNAIPKANGVGTNLTLVGGTTNMGTFTNTGRADFAGVVRGSNFIDRSNVKWWGAVGDGVTDDTAAIQNCISVANITSGRVWFPAGTYLITSISFASCNDMVIDGDQSLNRVIITGGTNGYPMFDILTSFRITMRNISFTPSAGIAPSCAILIGRNDANINGGSHLFERVTIYGNYTVAGLYGISSEVNTFNKCDFWQNTGDTNRRTCAYLAKDATNIYSTPARSLYHITEGAGLGGNGVNTFNECGFYSFNTNSGNSALVVEYGQGTSLRSCFIGTFGATNQVILLKGTTGFSWDMTAAESQSTNFVNSLAILGAGIYQGISISGFAYPIYAVDGAQLSDVMIDVSLAGISLENAIDVDYLRNSRLRFSEQVNEYGGGITNFLCKVRTSSVNVDYGVPTNRLVGAAVTNSLNTYGSVAFLDGNVGIGTATPGLQLDVIGAGRFSLGIYNNNIYSFDSLHYIMQRVGTATLLGDSAGGLLVVQDGGNVGIGTNAPASKLHVHGDSFFSGDVSALTFTDRSKSPDSLTNAYAIVSSITTTNGHVDHTKLHSLAWGTKELKTPTGRTITNIVSGVTNVLGGLTNVTARTTNVVVETLSTVVPDQTKRDLGMVISAQGLVIKDLIKRLEALEKK